MVPPCGHIRGLSRARVQVLDAQGCQDSRCACAPLSYRLLVLPIPKIDLDHPHGFQWLPSHGAQ
jgi:hypothetical protein